jgi:hypothetical protein
MSAEDPHEEISPGYSAGPLWAEMDQRRRTSASTLTSADLPCEPGVYAWYLDDRAVYVGTAKDLHARIKVLAAPIWPSRIETMAVPVRYDSRTASILAAGKPSTK